MSQADNQTEKDQTNEDLLEDTNDDLLDQDDSLTQEEIKKAEQELKVPAQPTRLSSVSSLKADLIAHSLPVPNDDITEPEPKDKENTPVAANSVEEKPSAEKKKITEEELEEKIKARAERFGMSQSEDAKKSVRAARFGDMVTKIGGSPPANLDALKKRSERFGTATSGVVKTVELTEAIKRRQERFGVISMDEPEKKKAARKSTGGSPVVCDEKMKARQARFGIK
jgi:hypothetical protein